MRCLLSWTVVNTHLVHSSISTPTQLRSHLACRLVQLFQRNMSAEKGERKSGSKDVSPSSDKNAGGSNGKSRSSSPGDNTKTTSEEANNDVQHASPSPSATTTTTTATHSPGRVTRQNIRNLEDIEEVKDKYLSMDLEAKRKLYKGSYVTLGDIKTWPDYFSEHLKQKPDLPTLKTETEVKDDLNKKISLFRGDITTLEIDAIVNAANESLLGGGGVDGAIHRAAGPHLRSECETLNGCEPGQAKITGGYKLAAKYVIHTVGPRGERPQVLHQCYSSCLDLVKEHKLTSVAFPCISTGIFGYPNVNAAIVALNTVREWLEQEEYAKQVERVIFCLFLKVDVVAYESLMPVYFPLEPAADTNANMSPSSEKSEKEESPSPSSEVGKCDSKEEEELRKD